MTSRNRRRKGAKARPDLGSVKPLLDIALDDGGEPDEISKRARAIVSGEVDVQMGIVEIFAYSHPRLTPEENKQRRLANLKTFHHHWSYAGPDVAAEIEDQYARERERGKALLDALLELNK